MQHTEIGALQQALAGPRPPHIIEYDAIARSLTGIEKDYPIVTICACPQDAGAVQAAQSLQTRGYRNAYPFAGWRGHHGQRRLPAKNLQHA